MNQPSFFSPVGQNMKSSPNSAATLEPSPVVYEYAGPTPIMNSTLSDSVNGFLNMSSVPYSVWRRLNNEEPLISISSQSLMTPNSTPSLGPTLASHPGWLHSSAAPISTTARGSLSSPCTFCVGKSTAAATAKCSMLLFMDPHITAPDIIAATIKQDFSHSRELRDYCGESYRCASVPAPLGAGQISGPDCRGFGLSNRRHCTYLCCEGHDAAPDRAPAVPSEG